MKKFVPILAAAAFVVAPAAANAQAFLQVEGGVDSVSADGDSEEGVAYGVSAGYDLPLSGSAFIGLQGTVADSTTKDCVRAGTEEVCLKSGRDLAAVVRLGTQVGEKTKLYVLGGYTNARLRLTYTDGVTSLAEGENLDGFRLGAGAQYNLSPSLFLKAEYRYSNYESDFSRHNGILAIGTTF